MIWKPLNIPEYNSKTNTWSKRNFSEYREFLSFLLSQEKYPGEYNLENTNLWRPHALKFLKDKRYTDYSPKSQEYKDFWLTEREKCRKGIIVDNFYVPRDYYFFLNFCPIYDKIKATVTHPEVWDGHYHYMLHLEISYYTNKNSVGTKARQKGYSLIEMARVINRLWFENKKNIKILGYDVGHIEGEWKIAEMYRFHLNEHTGWYRNFNPDKIYQWEQKIIITEGILDKKEKTKGNKSSLVARITKSSVAKAVGGEMYLGYITEAGVNPTLDKVIEFITPNITMGSIKTGMIDVMGAVGELKDCEPLKNYCFNPEENGFRGVVDRIGGGEHLVGFFHPTIWNYQYEDEDTKEVVRCYDENGNSDLELAKHYFKLAEDKAKKKGEKSYRLWKSQNPETLQDAFDERDTNPFPTSLLRSRENELMKTKPLTVELIRYQEDGKEKIKHTFVDKEPIANLKVNPTEDNTGSIIIYEFPELNPPLGLYYAGVDPIYNVQTTTSTSLFCIYIYKAVHEKNGKIVQGYPVAEYIGRHKRVSDTYQVALDLIEYYNALTAVESNVKDFIEWVIRANKSSYLLRRSQITAINEMQPNSTIREEIGFRMTAEFKKRCLEKLINYLEEPLYDSFDMTTGESETVYGVSKISSKGLIREMLSYSDRGNFDRLVAFMGAMIAAESNTNRHIIRKIDGKELKPPIISNSHFKPTYSKTTLKTSRGHFG